MTALPDYVVTTGDHIQEWLEDHDLNAAELARRLGVSRKHVSELLNGKAPLSSALALGLERVTGVPAKIWNQYETGYRSDHARLAEQERLRSQYDRARLFPLPYLRKWGFITASYRDHTATVSQLLALLGIADLQAFDATWIHSKVAYRKVAVGGDKSEAFATWLALGERHAALQDEPPPYDRPRLEGLVPQLRELTTQPDQAAAINQAIDLLRSAGVIWCLIPPIDGLGIHGATRWIGGLPLIQTSARGRTDDQLWFTLFHEIGHVLLHGDKTVLLDGAATPAEEEADQFASDHLVPPEWRAKLPTGRDLGTIRDLAQELGIAPSIVLGQAQRLTKDYGWGHGLKRKLEWAPTTGKE